jgi:hypothetical protein
MVPQFDTSFSMDLMILMLVVETKRAQTIDFQTLTFSWTTLNHGVHVADEAPRSEVIKQRRRLPGPISLPLRTGPVGSPRNTVQTT